MFRAPSCLFLIATLMACKSDSAEEKIQKNFDTSVNALESGQASDAIAILHPDFQGPEGLDRASAKLFVMGLLSREKIGITVYGDRIEVKDDTAVQTVEVLLTSRTGGGLLPQEASRKHYRLTWVQQDGDWQLKRLQDAGAP